MAMVFFSYSHKDEALRDQLEVHLSAMKRQGVISVWHDRRIAAGAEFENTIDRNIEVADVILLLVSPDFINSDYCYEREMVRALARHEAGEASVSAIGTASHLGSFLRRQGMARQSQGGQIRMKDSWTLCTPSRQH